MPSTHLADVLVQLRYLDIVKVAKMSVEWLSNPYRHGAAVHDFIHELYPVNHHSRGDNALS